MFLDYQAFAALHSLAGEAKIFDWALMFLAEYFPYVAVLAGLFFVLTHGGKKERIGQLLVGALSLVVSIGIVQKIIVAVWQRERPFLAFDFEPLIERLGPAFPSGHAIVMFTMALMVWSIDRRWGYWFFGFALLNGLARVASGVHWASDIAGGFLVALIVYCAAKKIASGGKRSALAS